MYCLVGARGIHEGNIVVKYFFKSLLEGERNSWQALLNLPTIIIGTIIGDGNFVAHYFLKVAFKIFLRKRMCLGVTSMSSSGLIHSMHVSKFIARGGASCTSSSVPDARMLVNFFSLHEFTSRSLSRVC